MKCRVFWDVAPCSQAEVDWVRALMMKAVRTSETSVNFVATRRYIPGDSKLQPNTSLRSLNNIQIIRCNCYY
jgi:hypothetical protein